MAKSVQEKMRKLLNVNGVGMSVAAMKTLLDDVEMVCLVRECRELEDGLDLNFTNKILCNDNISMKEIKNKSREVDKERLLRRCTEKAPFIAVVAEKVANVAKIVGQSERPRRQACKRSPVLI